VRPSFTLVASVRPKLLAKTNLTLEKEVSAKNFFLRGAKYLDDVPIAACPAQGFASLRCSSFHFDRDHGFTFSKKRTALRLRPLMAKIRTSTMSIDLAEGRNDLESWPEENWLAKQSRQRPLAAAITSLRQHCKTADMVPPLHGS
jgi:hypothetical protein